MDSPSVVVSVVEGFVVVGFVVVGLVVVGFVVVGFVVVGFAVVVPRVSVVPLALTETVFAALSVADAESDKGDFADALEITLKVTVARVPVADDVLPSTFMNAPLIDEPLWFAFFSENALPAPPIELDTY